MFSALNDGAIASGAGFDTHDHVSIKLLLYYLKDRLKTYKQHENEGVTRFSEVQVMNASSDIDHYEMNTSQTEYTNH